MKPFAVIKTVLLRKSLHFLIAFAPTLAGLNYPLSVLLLCTGTVFYAFAESLRFSGNGSAPLISKITILASHSRDKSRFVLGPVTLGGGALFALLILPPLPFTVAIYALAFGDGFAGIIGRIFGRIRPHFLFGKSVEGSFACFIAIFISTELLTQNCLCALSCALVGCLVEILPVEDFDNILIPLCVGLTANIILN
ncbi:MAG: phosphatidate cytidylyltransferase [Spirochaetaceae bacterium]|jgi:dolichol kinase|nr:phosphatidate cytidylyltransferase [Spirochaetaceae bacterium]